MISFKQYLEEKWTRERRYDTFEHPRHWTSKHSTHTEMVAGKKVSIHMTKYYNRRKKNEHHTDISFAVDGKSHLYDGEKEDHPHKIMKHVNRVISHYIQKSKPKSITMTGTSLKKTMLYHKYGQHLAKKFGGTHRVDALGSAEVTFNR